MPDIVGNIHFNAARARNENVYAERLKTDQQQIQCAEPRKALGCSLRNEVVNRIFAHQRINDVHERDEDIRYNQDRRVLFIAERITEKALPNGKINFYILIVILFQNSACHYASPPSVRSSSSSAF